MHQLLRLFVLVLALVLTATSRPALASPKDEADALILRARSAHKNGKFAEALDALKTAYVLDPRPELLYAIGQLHLGLGQCSAAISFYERFLSTHPEPGPAWAANQAIESCTKPAVGPTEPAAKPTSTQRPEAPPLPRDGIRILSPTPSWVAAWWRASSAWSSTGQRSGIAITPTGRPSSDHTPT